MPPRRRENATRNISSERSRAPTLRPSGVRSTAERVGLVDEDEDDRSEAPTLPPPPSLRDVRDASAPLQELLYRFEVGDHKGALAAAETLLDQRLVPTIIIPWELLAAMGLEPCPMLLLTFIDGRSSLETMLESCGVPMIEALRALCSLLDRRIVVLR